MAASCSLIREDLQSLVALLSPCEPLRTSTMDAVEQVLLRSVQNGSITTQEQALLRSTLDDARRTLPVNEHGAIHILQLMRRTVVDGFADKLRRCTP